MPRIVQVNPIMSAHLFHFQITNEEGMFLGRQDVMIDPFTGPMQHLFPRLEAWMHETKASLREEILNKVRL